MEILSKNLSPHPQIPAKNVRLGRPLNSYLVGFKNLQGLDERYTYKVFETLQVAYGVKGLDERYTYKVFETLQVAYGVKNRVNRT